MRTFIKECKWGEFILLHGDMISQYVNLYGEWSETEVELFQMLLPRHGNVIEVGSNIGTHAIPLSVICSDGKVFCYEPQTPIFHILCGNIAINNRLNVIVRAAAVGEFPGQVDIATSTYDQPWNYGSFSIAQGFNTEGSYGAPTNSASVEVITLDTDPALSSLNTIDLLKIDAEGFEPAVLAGARNLIARHHPRIFVEANSAPVVEKILGELSQYDYVGYWFISHRFRLDNYNQSGFRIPGYDTNIIFTHRDRPFPGSDRLQKVNNFDDIAKGVSILDSYR
ncbi:hypothetical protein WK39_03790 [Burkholderia cepacia]|uniref:FkbM family methyltransferase n=1 Tax=Burkholderia cepacia TaxID=292 RepID=UPI0007560ED1|nr:FkbM family methyltransferase [Burkholderia cepacia]KVS53409.1 hypothetical protein WK39_03790 [Burkholderia cepacia]KVS57871.1 hypothetical protein WK40_26240 [Burkholderia cepacia]RQT84738.1 FkbM family methyltransferase [Burkholderia cepacia]RQU04074.1 FkbM family methyltransferase [Burkholderia cepacia]RQZ80753.1 FkbM family methyltransferase [Burkholderia cepacia]